MSHDHHEQFNSTEKIIYTLDIGIPLANMPIYKVLQINDEIETVLNRLRNHSGCNDQTRDMKFTYHSISEVTNAKNNVLKIFRKHNLLIDNEKSYIYVVDSIGHRKSII